jgi:hypothetical protein
LETWEQYEAMNPRGVNRKDLGNGRSEISWFWANFSKFSLLNRLTWGK